MNLSSLTRRIVFVSLCLSTTSLRGDIDGFTEPYREIDVAASESGTLSVLEVEEGDEVVKGQRLGTLDDNVLRASLDVASQNMKSQGRLKSAFAEYKMQRERAQKISGLRQRDHASQAEYDQVLAEYEIALANVQSMREELQVKKLEYAQIKAQLDRRQIVSPINGIVTAIVKDQGEYVSGNDPVVLQVVQLDPLQITFFVPSEFGRSIRRDEEVDLEIGATHRKAQGTVAFVSPAADAQSGTVRVKVLLPNPDLLRQSGELCHLLLPGMQAEPSDGTNGDSVAHTTNGS